MAGFGRFGIHDPFSEPAELPAHVAMLRAEKVRNVSRARALRPGGLGELG